MGLLTPHFKDTEFAYSHPLYRGINPVMNQDFLLLIEAFRQFVGKPIIVTPNGGFRAQQFNDNPDSMHTQGRAADIYCPKLELGELARLAFVFVWDFPLTWFDGRVIQAPAASKVGNVNAPFFRRFGGIGLYPQNHFLHVDDRAELKTWVRIDGQYIYF